MPVAPYFPTVVITIRTLEVFRAMHLRCPCLGIQAFVRALCNIHSVAPRPWLGAQFSVAFDVYLAILAQVDKHVQVALGRDAPDWCLKNACQACLYKVEGEPHLRFAFMGTIDGNNSLSRFFLHEREVSLADGTSALGTSRELRDNRVVPGDYYLPREEVDKWSKEEEEEEDDSGCADRWQNMKEEVTACSYGMYDETGFFPALCRHGFVLKVVDMVRSGELSKYPPSLTAHIPNVLGEVVLAYDIGCKFKKLVKVHPLLKELATNKNFRALVGAFHGHRHGRLCGLENLMTYVEGMGLEAGEGCEIFFSKSNALASTTRYASRFHRQQAIMTYLKHVDTFETYCSLSLLASLLCSKYRRALEIKATYGSLRTAMQDLGVESQDIFETWRAKEKAHLLTLSKEPAEETLEMEYYQKLVNLKEADYIPSSTFIGRHCVPFIPAETDDGYAEAVKATCQIETQQRHTLELQARALAAVQELEVRLAVTTRWMPGGEKWTAVAKMVGKRRYQRALDHLQGLIIARMFELAKCNMSGTGYKLRKHITKSLQARSKAVKAAIARYNEAAEAMTPPKPTLNWEEVMEYAFLVDLDLLHEGREDIRGELWAQPAGRAAMDQHFKLLRADKEIIRLNVEIHCFITYMVDEEAFIIREEGHLREEGMAELAHQVCLVRMEHARFTPIHMSQLVKLSKVPGFTGNILAGTSLCRNCHTPVTRDRDVEMRLPSPSHPLEDVGVAPVADGDESDDEDGTLADAPMNILQMSGDNAADTEER
ncbi:hypothetical protein DFH07DRAFT_870697 [Mycena maculata]|uniref:CxC2-like cysteine cluster KDZ transposase-associated domain-containing protein n=1 Tax=Mycena maculata TaxID=230809 RepID=A0AAD7MWM1_9AGAR|nr:hypothetical protein DFH07DRAFT_870697 [Mycena maculata]